MWPTVSGTTRAPHRGFASVGDPQLAPVHHQRHAATAAQRLQERLAVAIFGVL